MNAFLHPAHRQTLFGVLIACVVIAATLLPLSGAETKGKKAAKKDSAEVTPKKKKSSDNSSGSSTPKSKTSTAEETKTSTPKPSATPKSSPKSKSTPKKSKTESSSAGGDKKATKTVANPSSPSKKQTEGDAAGEVGEATGPKTESTPEKSEIPGQPAPALPTREASGDTPATPAAGTETPAAGGTPTTPAPDAASSKETEDSPATVKKGKLSVSPNVSLSPEDLLGYELQPARVQQLIKSALELARQKLTYTYGSADPANGGMDCSGAVHYLLTSQGFKDVPRDASGQYVWARKHGQFFAVVSKKADSFEFGDLMPGDLLFWNGTYNVQRDPPVTHTMIYLGVQRKRAQHVMWGSSDGRTYDSKPRWGVSVFDFKMPRADRNVLEPAKADFLGYARIPGLRE